MSHLWEFAPGLFTVKAVADRAHVNKRTVYRHFPDKEGLAVSGTGLCLAVDGRDLAAT